MAFDLILRNAGLVGSTPGSPGGDIAAGLVYGTPAVNPRIATLVQCIVSRGRWEEAL